MVSSCNSNCFINCDKVVSDQCVQYTGSAYPTLNVCQGDQLSTTEQNILTNLVAALNGTLILPQGVTLVNCSWLSAQFGAETPNVNNYLQLLINATCSLNSSIVSINNQLAEQSMNFNTACIQNVPANPSTNQVLQAVITTVCGISTVVNSLPTTYVALTDLPNLVNTQIQQYITNTQTGQVQYNQYLPLGVALPYFGSLSNFDNTGKGLATVGMSGIYLCNGNNGTPDLRGRTIVGAVNGVPGGTLANPVNPLNPANAPGNVNYNLNDTFGENFHTLVQLEMPSHNHAVSDPGHTHNISAELNGGGPSQPVYVVDNSTNTNKTQTIFTGKISTSTTGVGLSSTGGSNPHNNVQPSIACYFIIRMV